jgi:hypothetical protein
MADAGLKIVIGADISAVTDGMKVAASNVAQFGDVASKAFDEVAASSAALGRVSDLIDKMAAEAIGAGNAIESIGDKNVNVRFPLADIDKFKASVRILKTDLQNGIIPKNIEVGFSKISQGAAQAEVSLNRLKPGANQAANALQGVGRVAQDLPFGFIGIQNNLNPLLESFQRLKAETGSSKAALSALGQSLIGPAGLGIALSVISAGILIYQNGIAGFNKKTKEAADKAKEAADKLKEFLAALKSVAEVTDTATAGQAGNIAQVQALANVVRDTTASYDERKRALQDLQQVNKNYFGDLKLEENQMALLTDRVNEYSKAIVAQAVLKGFTDEISRVSIELSNQDRALKKTSEQLGRAKKALDATGLNDVTARQGTVEATKNYIALQQEIKKLEPVYKAQRDVVEQLQTNYALLNGEIDEATRNTLKLRDLNAPGTQKAENDGLSKQLSLLEKIRDAAKERQGKLFDLKDIDEATGKLAALEQQVGDLKLQIALRDAKKAGLPPAEIEKLKDAIKQDTEKRLNEAFEKEALLLEFSAKLKFSLVKRAELPGNIDSVIAKSTGFDKKIPVITIPEVRLKFQREGVKFRVPAEILNALDELNIKLKEQIKGIFEGGLSDVFAGLGEGLSESLGEAITGDGLGDGLKKAAQNILGIVGSVMQQLGKALITAAIKIKLLKETFEKWAIANPALAIVAGIGLVAAGAALKNLKFDGPKFATGGIVSSPLIGQIGEQHRPEVIMPLDRLPQLFKQFGGDFGGGLQMVPIINNEGLYLAVKRGERSAGRKF